ncbi:MAG: valine--tRNA ligase [Candidatus Cloacimonetes bacterium]|nr:valine--tRNA ligase [Candidatus Cloacimonadota bacterium]
MSRHELSKVHEACAVESRIYQSWEDAGCFAIAPDSPSTPFVITMPPPNVTGRLHMGHGLQDSVQDVFIRCMRMKGFDAHWQPGKDHAGIATQAVVEKKLAAQGITRHQLGREAFIEKVWEWKQEYGDAITQQKRKLGDSADWSTEVFTMDPGPSRAVREVFVRLYEKGLIYQGYYIVNWCPRCHTAISDEEVEHEDHAGHLWQLAYPVADAEGNPTTETVIVATTRPETMLGDVAVAVHPEDERYRHLIGKRLVLPIVGRLIPVIADEFVSPEFGTGCVKVTPAHDPNDFEMGKRHSLEPVIVMDINGCMNEEAGAYRGLDRYDCRKALLKHFEEDGTLRATSDHAHSVGHCSRCHTVIEPYLSRQWFVKMKPLAERAMQAVADGEVQFHPLRWRGVFERWMENIRDWCISRQLWWGHRIPVFTCEDCGETMVTREDPSACTACGSEKISQDEDVLDTWFSSWLWPFSTLGWPDDTPMLRRYYPTQLMVTGYDIIFFWVSRMIMAGLEFTDRAPFAHVYFTGMVKDEQGRKMSKSLNNGIDPLEMADKYGADAVRFCMVTLNTEGQDIKLSEQKFEMGRNFANKIWQAFRFVQMQDWSVLGPDVDISQPCLAELADTWIVSRLHSTTARMDASMEAYRPNDALSAAYEFFWNEYCDWFVELAKPRLYDKENPERQRAALHNALHVFCRSMQLLHPFMPFITEEIWRIVRDELEEVGTPAPWGEFMMKHAWPTVDTSLQNDTTEAEFRLVQGVVTAVRNIRAEQNLKPRQELELVIQGESERMDSLRPVLGYLQQLAFVNPVRFGGERPRPAAASVVEGLDVLVPLAGLIDLDKERERLGKERVRLEGFLRSGTAKLANADFVARAPEAVIEKERAKLADAQDALEKILRSLEQLG